MTQEEKAKAYDEALKVAVAAHKDEDKHLKATLERIFPELKESEDEKIRKELIDALKRYNKRHVSTNNRHPHFEGIEVDKALTWLEKQGKETSWKPSKEEMDVLYGLAYITNQYDEHKEEVITCLYQDLKREFFNDSSYENMFPNTEDGVRRRSTIQVLEYARSLDNYNQYGKEDIDKNIAWLEKQGEKEKEVTCTYEVEVGNGNIKALVTEKIPTDKVEPKDYSSTDPHFFKPTDKVEPKFKVGDWIISNSDMQFNIIAEITSIRNSLYYIRNIYGNEGYETWDSLRDNYHLWTIQDAKDGDVLARNNDILSICIFSRFDGINNKYSSFLCRCGLEGEELGQELSINGYHDDSKDYVPATKEQRDLLFAKIHEAGYVWDIEKKELNKIEKKSVEWSEEDEVFLKDTIECVDFVYKNYSTHKDIYKNLSNNTIDILEWLNSLKKRMEE